MSDSREYEQIVEFCFLPKEEQFVIRFLDNTSYVLRVADLPKKMLTRKPLWENATVSKDRNALLVLAGSEFREVPAHVIHSRGRLL
jgi:hypothetical protein